MTRAIPSFSRNLAADFGRMIHDVRRAWGWSQRELARRAATSQSVVSRIEAGRPEAFDLEVVGRLFEVLGIRMHAEFDLPPLATARRGRSVAHDRCVTYIAGRLRAAGYDVATEVEVGDGRWRMWIDVLAIHPATGLLIVIEVKTELHDVAGEQRRVAAYEREAWAAARRLGWAPSRRVAALLLLRSLDTDRSVGANAQLVRMAFPGSAADLSSWIRDPSVAPRNARALASIDPRTRRRTWLMEAGEDGRRTRPAYRDYADFMRQLPA